MPFADRVELVGYEDLEGRAGFKLALQESGERFYLYVASFWEPGLDIVEVTDPARPRFVPPPRRPARHLDAPGAGGGRPHDHKHGADPPGWGDSSPDFDEGLTIWDVGDPEDPKVLGKWATGDRGTHRNFYAGGRYVHAAARLPGFDGHVYAIVDIDDPEEPRLVGRWWWPGQHTAGGEQFSAGDAAKLTSGRPAAGMHTPALSLHAGPYVEGDRAYGAWMRAGFVLLDISAPSEPQLLGSLPVYPPLGSSIAMHTAVPLPERKLVVINSEALNERCQEPANFAGIVDVSDERDPVLISLFPTPVAPEGYTAPSFCAKGGRFGPHNQHQPQGHPSLQPIGHHVYLTYFNAGLQVFDISDPHTPRIAGYYIPDDPETRRGPLPTDLVTQVEDVLVDRRGYAYVTDKNAGVTILRLDLAVELRILGPSGLRVSRLCLGVATFGNVDWGCDQVEAGAILDRFLDAGGNFVDTANKYADGRSEEVLGNLLGSRRDAVVLGTKYTAGMEPDANSSGNHRKSLVRSLEASLRRLQTDYVDILWVHAWDGVTPIEEVVRALDDQVRSGKVLSVGISNAPAWMIAHGNAVAALLGRSPFVAVQNEYNLLERGAERELLPMARYFGLGYLAWAPIAQGRLTGKYATPSEEPKRLTKEELEMSAARERIVAETVAVAGELGCQPATVAQRWIVQRRPDVIPILGARTSEQFEANMRSLEIELSPEQVQRLDAVSAIDLGSPTRFMRTNESGRDFMWGEARTVPAGTPRPGAPWWEL